MKYIRIPIKHRRAIEELSDPEAGRLIKALIRYADGAEVDQLPGKESGAFSFLRDMVDEDRTKAAKNAATYRENGRKGGRPKNQSGFEKTKAVLEKPKRLHINIDDDDNIARTQEEHNELFAAAERAGFPVTGATMDALVDLYASHGKQAVLDGIKSCVDHSVLTLAYLRACLARKPKREGKCEADPTGGFGWL